MNRRHFLGLGLAPLALAHNPICQCEAGDGEEIVCTGGFSDGSGAPGVTLDVISYEEEVLVPGKRTVAIDKVEPVGSYAVRLTFDDGHNTGLYSWDVLEDLGANHARYWQRYLERLAEHGLSRDSAVTKLSALPAAPGKWKPG